MRVVGARAFHSFCSSARSCTTPLTALPSSSVVKKGAHSGWPSLAWGRKVESSNSSTIRFKHTFKIGLARVSRVLLGSSWSAQAKVNIVRIIRSEKETASDRAVDIGCFSVRSINSSSPREAGREFKFATTDGVPSTVDAALIMHASGCGSGEH